jgi:hypothetical protein
MMTGREEIGYKILIPEHGGQKLLGRPKVKGQYNIKMTL